MFQPGALTWLCYDVQKDRSTPAGSRGRAPVRSGVEAPRRRRQRPKIRPKNSRKCKTMKDSRILVLHKDACESVGQRLMLAAEEGHLRSSTYQLLTDWCIYIRLITNNRSFLSICFAFSLKSTPCFFPSALPVYFWLASCRSCQITLFYRFTTLNHPTLPPSFTAGLKLACFTSPSNDRLSSSGLLEGLRLGPDLLCYSVFSERSLLCCRPSVVCRLSVCL